MKLMVIDGNSIINRAFYGIRPLTTRSGIPTNAVYGFIVTLQRLLQEENPEALCVTFDRREPTFRHLAYEGYKAQRKGMPEELAAQMPILKEVLDAMNIPRYELAGFEADDLIGTISRKCEAAGWECVVVTGDKDSLQLITEHTKVKLVSSRMGQTTTKDMNSETFRAEYGFDPIHIIDLKALMGDTSDNIPGVTGVGEKTAMALIQQYQSIDAIYAAMPEVNAKPAMLRKLEAGEESARMSYQLATIVTDAPLEFEVNQNMRGGYKAELYDIFLRLEFTKLIEKMGLTAQEALPTTEMAESAPDSCTSETVTDWTRMQELLEGWKKCDTVSCLVLPDLSGVCVVWNNDGTDNAVCILSGKLNEYNDFLRYFFSAEIKKVTHNAKDIIRILLAEAFPTDGIVFDTALAGYLLDATAGHYDLEHLGAAWLNRPVSKAVYLDRNSFTAIGEEAEAMTAWSSHTKLIADLYAKMLPRLHETNVGQLYFDVELPLCRVLAEMELSGFHVDAQMLRSFGETLSCAISTLEEQIYSYAGEFNINSPKQLGEVLFERLSLPVYKKTKTGYSTNAEVLDKLRGQHPIVDAVLEYRQYAKLKSTYVDGLLKVIEPDGRVRTSFQMTVTATGRLSSTEPNLQNIPTRTELGSELRRMFAAEDGKVLVDADYSQIELRILAHISGDEAMKNAFLSGEDFHTVTAAHVFGVSVDEVTGAMRRAAKAVNFGIVYGISPFSLSQDLGVTVTEAKAYMDAYFTRFPGVKDYMERVVEQAKTDGYVETLMHRRRNLPEIKASNHNMRSFGERVALNMPVQGTAADIMKIAMVRVFDRMKREKLASKLIMQVHDELIVECPVCEVEQVKALLTEEMEGALALAVPLTTEAHSGKTWLDAK
ncbi:MAG: DNA polymerase I [Oscillospiraceae bacterium]|nr:DNA polymerase I [Oscillospiraceae bacterium]